MSVVYVCLSFVLLLDVRPCPSFIPHVWVVLTLPPYLFSSAWRSSIFLPLRGRDGIAIQIRPIVINFRTFGASARKKEVYLLLELSKDDEM